jgi:hypothetical protein
MNYSFFKKMKINREKALVVILGISLLSSTSYAQRKYNNYIPYSVVGFGIGTSSYYGDMAPIGNPIGSTFRPMRWSITGNYTRHFTPRLAARGSFTWARIFGDDNIMYDDPSHFLYSRNLHFRNDLKEFALLGIFKLTPDTRSNDRRPQFGAYLFGGVAAVAHSPFAKDQAGKWRKLRPMQNEGTSYSVVTMAIPVGLGLRYKINAKWDISAELGFRFTRSDYLDDVHGNYADPATLTNPDMAYRAAEQLGGRKRVDRTEGLTEYLAVKHGVAVQNNNPFVEIPTYYGYGTGSSGRGNTPTRNDHYMLGMIHLNYILGSPIKCPPLR